MRKVLIGVAVVLLVLVGLGVFALTRLDPKDFIDLLDAKVQEATGRELKIDGKVGYSLSLRPTVAAEGIRFSNAPWGSRPDMLTAKRVEIQIALLPLVSGKVEVRGLTLIEPDVLLEIGADGAKNWQFKPADSKTSSPDSTSVQQIEIRNARIDDGVITYREAKAKRDTRIGLNRITLTGSAGDLELQGTASVNEVPIEVGAKVDHGGRLGTPGAIGKAELAFSAPGIKLNGKGAVPVSAAGLAGMDLRFNAEVGNWETLAKLARGNPASLPPLRAEGAARAKAGSLLFEELEANLGKSSATGTVRIGLGEKANAFEARLDSPFVDLAELQAARKPAKAAKPSSDSRIFSAEPFELDGVRALSGSADLRIAKLALRDGKTLDGVHALASFDKGKIVADPIRITVEGKELRVRVKADASSGKALALDLALQGQGISLAALAAMLDIPGAPQGSPTDLSIRLTGTGNSVRSLMAGANGDVRIVVGPGRLEHQMINFGADITELLNAINPARKSEPYTELRCAVIRLPIRQGMVRVDNGIAAETAKVNVIGGGVIDLRTEALDLGFRPKAATGLGVGLGSLARLGRLRGTLAAPKVEIDAAGAASVAAPLGLAVVTGGLSALAGALLIDSVPDNPCQAALSGAVSQPAKTQQQPGVIDSVVGGVKRLFGR